VWSERYDRVIEDIFDIQDDISRAIVEKLKVKLASSAGVLTVRRHTADPATYNAYLRGRYHWNKRTVQSYRKAVDHFQEAVERDPEFPLPHVGLADCLLLSAYYGGVSGAAIVDRAERLITHALELDESSPEAHASLGFLQSYFFYDWRRAEAAYRRAIELGPLYAPVHLWLACTSLGMQGRLDEAGREVERAIELDPALPTYYGGAMQLALWRGQFDLVQAIARKTLELDADAVYPLCVLIQALAETGQHEEAIATASHAMHLLPPGSFYGPGQLGYCCARCGREEDARRTLADLEGLRAKSYAQAAALAAVCTGLGEKERALDWLDRAYEERCGYLSFVRYDPVWDSLRDEPRYHTLVRKMNLSS